MEAFRKRSFRSALTKPLSSRSQMLTLLCLLLLQVNFVPSKPKLIQALSLITSQKPPLLELATDCLLILSTKFNTISKSPTISEGPEIVSPILIIKSQKVGRNKGSLEDHILRGKSPNISRRVIQDQTVNQMVICNNYNNVNSVIPQKQ